MTWAAAPPEQLRPAWAVLTELFTAGVLSAVAHHQLRADPGRAGVSGI